LASQLQRRGFAIDDHFLTAVVVEVVTVGPLVVEFGEDEHRLDRQLARGWCGGLVGRYVKVVHANGPLLAGDSEQP
jgi:hypothetical protein